jgi:hypothetical protein
MPGLGPAVVLAEVPGLDTAIVGSREPEEDGADNLGVALLCH